MRKGIIAAVAVTLGLILAVMAPFAFAKVVTGENSTVRADQTINDDLFIAGTNVVIDGTVNGDVYAAGNTITIRGTVNGDVIAGGQTIIIEGKVRDHVRAAGQSIQLNGASVGAGLSAFGQTVTVDAKSTIGGGVIVAAQTAQLRASIAHGITGAAQDLTIDNVVTGDVNVAVKSLVVGSNAVVNGKISYRAEDDAQVDPAAKLVGGSEKLAPPPKNPDSDRGRSMLFVIVTLLASFVTGAVLLRLVPRPVAMAAGRVRERLWASLGIGLVALIVAVPLAILLSVTLVGLPLGLMALGAFVVSVYLSHLVVALVVGNWILELINSNTSRYLALAVGLVVLAIVGLVPVIGGIVGGMVVLVGLGAIVQTKAHYLKLSSHAKA
jgi:cytoskeletal protein CcmA (bactofilin family)